MRSREQIIADWEKRFEELRREAEAKAVAEDEARKDPRNVYSCRTCRFAKWDHSDLEEWHCHEPLVKGFGKPPMIGSWSLIFGGPYTDKRKPSAYTTSWKFPPLCGPEKALWQPKPTICQRILAFLAGDTP